MFWRWELPEQERIFTALTIDGAYHAAKSTLASSEDPPYFLVEGAFYEGQELEVRSVPAPETEGSPLASYMLSVNGYEGEMTVRMLTSADGSLYLVSENGSTEPLSYTRDGSYIVFRMPSGGSFLYTDTASHSGLKALPTEAVIALVAVPVLLAAGLFLLLRRKKKKSGDPKRDQE